MNKNHLSQPDLLSAIWTISCAAKNSRDAEEKELLSELKERGIATAIKAGWLVAVRQAGGMIEYRSKEFCFHTRLVLSGVSIPFDHSVLFSEEGPETSGNIQVMRLLAAQALDQLPWVDTEEFREVHFHPELLTYFECDQEEALV